MRLLKNLLKVGISLGLFSYLVWISDPRQVLQVLGNVYSQDRLVYLFYALIAGFVSVGFLAWRWQIVLQAFHLEYGLSRLYGIYLIGMFFNNFLPTSIGGDIVRIYRVADESDDRTLAFSSVIIERLLGIAATLFLSILALFYVSRFYRDSRLMIMTIVLFVAIIIFFVLMFRDRPFKFLLRLFDRFTLLRIGERFNKMIGAIHMLKDQRGVLLSVFVLSVLSQASIVLMNWALVWAFQLKVGLVYLFLVVPVTFLLTMLPSINGVGFRDGGYIFFLSKVGVANAGAISLSFMNVIIPMFISIFGGFLFMVQRKKSKQKEIEAIEESL
ncbi:MAG TPA: flippase-like domain-containing protein [Caldithrix abyssi]|uniref:Flippase-like domain-containing protein n=1 Tax=Caldithrix abyssi TaxID=187145 RepID=A0A7V1M1R9_CALAY|nr:flippase-like domain-containing protein [Caldithrix abyssi]